MHLIYVRLLYCVKFKRSNPETFNFQFFEHFLGDITSTTHSYRRDQNLIILPTGELNVPGFNC